MATPYLTLRNAQPASLAATQIAVSTLTGSTLSGSTLSGSILSVQNLSTTGGNAQICRQPANPTRYIEMGTDSANTSYIDFHSEDNVEVDFSTRILSVGGSTIGSGALMIYGSSIGINTSAMTSNFQLSTTMTADLGGALKTQYTNTGITAATAVAEANSGAIGPYNGIYGGTLTGSGPYTITSNTTSGFTGIRIASNLTPGAYYQVSITCYGTIPSIKFDNNLGGIYGTFTISGSSAVYTTTVFAQQTNSYLYLFSSAYPTSIGQTIIFSNITVQRLDTVATGRVGVNTTNPYAPLHVYGNSTGKVAELIHNPNATVGSAASLQYGLWQVSGSDSNGTGANGPAADISAICQNSANGNTDLSFSTYTGSLAAPTTYTLTERLRITAGGNVGIGSTTPSMKLTIHNGTSFVNANPESTNALATGLNLIRTIPDGNRTLYTGQYVGKISFSGADYSWNPQKVGADISAVTADVQASGASCHLVFGTLTNTTDSLPTEKMRITAGGNVGIGTTNPIRKLDVIGDTHVSGQMSQTYSVTTGITPLGSTLGNIAFIETLGTGSSAEYGKVDVYGIRTANGSDWTSTGIRMQRTVDVTNMGFLQFGGLGTSDAGMSMGVGSSYHVHMDSSGNVGIGTTAPASKFVVYNRSGGGGGSDIKYASFVFAGESTTNDPVSKLRLGWYSEYWDMNACRSGSVQIDNLTFTVNGGSPRFTIGGNGDVYAAGTVNGTAKNFMIPHPVQPTEKKLVHASVEGPRMDLMYRGSVALQAGQAIVNMNTDSTSSPECAMSAGTFEALCRNPVFYLQNMDGFARVKGKIQGAILTITAEDPTCTDTVSWMVVAERKDPYVIQAGHTTEDGCLITEVAVEPISSTEPSSSV